MPRRRADAAAERAGAIRPASEDADLADDLALEAKRYAARHGLTLRAVIEEGTRSTLRGEGGARGAFVLRDASVDGAGLQAAFRDEAWSRVRDVAYEGRGG